MFAPCGAERRSPKGGASALGAARRYRFAPDGAARRSPQGGASALGAARRRSSIDLAEHDVLRANDGHGICNHVTASHFVERL